ncbi:MAG: hypothetical protein M1324_04655 [Patescibacteria group bacterium]|nr:hypothetical protein [Patescibacteria group bacterium]
MMNSKKLTGSTISLLVAGIFVAPLILELLHQLNFELDQIFGIYGMALQSAIAFILVFLAWGSQSCSGDNKKLTVAFVVLAIIAGVLVSPLLINQMTQDAVAQILKPYYMVLQTIISGFFAIAGWAMYDCGG